MAGGAGAKQLRRAAGRALGIAMRVGGGVVQYCSSMGWRQSQWCG